MNESRALFWTNRKQMGNDGHLEHNRTSFIFSGLRDSAEAAPHARGGGEAEAVRDPRLLRRHLAVPQQRLQRGRLPKVLPARPGKIGYFLMIDSY